MAVLNITLANASKFQEQIQIGETSLKSVNIVKLLSIHIHGILPEEDGDQFYRVLGDHEFLPTPGRA